MTDSTAPPDLSGAAHVAPLALDAMDAVEDVVDMARQVNGYVPTSLRIMARKPAMLRAFVGLRDSVMRAPGEVPAEVRWLAAHAVSAAAGCLYCQAHTGANSVKAGLEVEKIEALLRYETDPRFSDAERAVIALGLAAGETPNASERAHFEALRAHFSDDGIVEIVAVISLFGFLNRWNDTFASDLEDAPAGFAAEHLGERGWAIGKHRG